MNHKKYLFDRTFFHGRWVGGGGEGGAVDERYVTLGGVYRPALQGGGGVSSLPKKALRNT